MLLAAALLVTAMILAMASVAPADPGDKCKDSMLDGLYVFTASGFGNVSPGPPQPQAIVELIRFNGDGSVNVPGGRISVNGAIFTTGPSTGTYTTPTPVDTGCESILTFADPPHPTLYIFIPRDAKTLQMILINRTPCSRELRRGSGQLVVRDQQCGPATQAALVSSVGGPTVWFDCECGRGARIAPAC
jgi:hypothetical protein